MRRSPALPLALLVLLGLATAWGFATLLGKRYESGTAYPVYSSLRSDPLGTKALYEALDRLPQTRCERSFKKMEKLEGAPGITLLLLHMPSASLSMGSALNGEDLRAFAARGGRVVITIAGQSTGLEGISEEAEKRRDENAKKRIREKLKGKKEEEKDPEKKETDENKIEEATNEFFKYSKSMTKLFGVAAAEGKFILQPKGGYQLSPTPDLPLTPQNLPLWYSLSALELDRDRADEWKVLDKVKADKWKVLAEANDQAVLAELAIGSGKIVMATDSYFASNEGLWKEPAPAFLSWLTGGARTIIFDETHLGTQENPGIMTLARRYHLHGLFVGGLVLFVLFVWKSSSSLLPHREDGESTTNVVSGQGAASGLVSLLKRGIPRAQLLRKGLEAWEHQQPVLSPAQKQRLDQARSLLPPPETKRLRTGMLADTYRRVCAALHPKPRQPTP